MGNKIVKKNDLQKIRMQLIFHKFIMQVAMMIKEIDKMRTRNVKQHKIKSVNTVWLQNTEVTANVYNT